MSEEFDFRAELKRLVEHKLAAVGLQDISIGVIIESPTWVRIQVNPTWRSVSLGELELISSQFQTTGVSVGYDPEDRDGQVIGVEGLPTAWARWIAGQEGHDGADRQG